MKFPLPGLGGLFAVAWCFFLSCGNRPFLSKDSCRLDSYIMVCSPGVGPMEVKISLLIPVHKGTTLLICDMPQELD